MLVLLYNMLLKACGLLSSLPSPLLPCKCFEKERTLQAWKCSTWLPAQFLGQSLPPFQSRCCRAALHPCSSAERMGVHRHPGHASILATPPALLHTGYIRVGDGGPPAKLKSKGIWERKWRSEHQTRTSSSIISSRCCCNPQYKLAGNAESLSRDYLYQCRLWSTGWRRLITDRDQNQEINVVLGLLDFIHTSQKC